jgi:hypothetical protein
MSTYQLRPVPVEQRLRDVALVSGHDRDLLRVAVEHAIMAPSVHNTQPWRFRLDGSELALRADRIRALPILDPDGRELVLSCGAALYFVRAVVRVMGHEPLVALAPDPSDPDLLATVRVGATHEPTALDHRLVNAMFARRTHRRRFMDLAVNDDLLGLLEEAASSEGAWLAWVEQAGARAALADLIAQADRLQWEDPLFRDELAAWTRPNKGDHRDGVPGYAMGQSDVRAALGPFMIRTFDMGAGRAARDRELAEHSPLLAVLGTPGDGVTDWLLAGQALGRVLLQATVEGVSASYLNQPVEVPSLRARLSTVTDRAGAHQVVMRMGYGYQVRGTPRRDVTDVLEIAPDPPGT